MVNPIPVALKSLWNSWNIRASVLFSLFFQAFLTLSAPLRKRTGNKIVNFFIWFAYLLADATALFAIGLIASNEESPASSDTPDNSDLMVFWSSFLLLHLGGPDTITAFALEDNELWPRHLLGLLVQIVGTGYVIILTLPENKIMIPTFLMFLAGIIKYSERTRSLYVASTDRIQYATARSKKGDKSVKNEKEGSEEVKSMEEDIDQIVKDVQIEQEAYGLFQQYKGVIVDRVFTKEEVKRSRAFFSSIEAEHALRVIETELNFLYEFLYTKNPILHTRLGYIFRCVSFSSVVSALAIFHFVVRKQGFNKVDIRITYGLLFGAVGLDIIAIFMGIFSDWTAVIVRKIKIFEWANPA